MRRIAPLSPVAALARYAASTGAAAAPATPSPAAAPGGDDAPKATFKTETPEVGNAAEAMPSYAAAAAVEDPHRWRRWLCMGHEVLPTLSLVGTLTGTFGWLCLFGLPASPYYGLAWLAGVATTQRLVSRGLSTHATADMKGKLCVVTGGSSGIGQEVAASLAQMGATVIVTAHSTAPDAAVQGVLSRMRDNAARDAAEAEGRVTAWPLHLEERLSVQKFANTLKSTFPAGIDVFVNNAGCMMEEAVVNTRNGHERTIDVNLLGTMQLTELALPLVAKRDGRVVMVTSHGHRTITSRRDTIDIVGHFFARKYEATVLPSHLRAEQKKLGNHPGVSPAVGGASPLMEAARKEVPVDGDDDDYFDADPDYNTLQQFYASHFGRLCYVQSLQGRGVKAVSVNPGRALTRLRRLMYPRMTDYSPLVVTFLMRTQREASWGVVNACVAPETAMHWGGYYYKSGYKQGGASKFVECNADAVVSWAAGQIGVPLWGCKKKGGQGRR